MSSATISRLFVELSGNAAPLNTELLKAVAAADAAGLSITKSGRSFINAFDEALDPTKRLTEQIRLLEAAGKSQSDIAAVMGDKIRAASEAATAHGQAVDPLISKYAAMSSGVKNAGVSFADFARDPVGAAQTALGNFLEKLGPVGIGLGALGAGAIAAGIGIFKFIEGASEAQERLDNLSAITGISNEKLQALELIAKNAGLEGLDLWRTIGKLNQELAKGDTSSFGKELDALGISLKDMNGNQKDAITLLDEARLKLLAIEDPAQRAQAANEVLGGRLRELIPLLLNSKTGLADMAQSMIDLGVTTDKYTQESLRSFDAMMDGINTSFTWLKNTAIAGLMGILEEQKAKFEAWADQGSTIWEASKVAMEAFGIVAIDTSSKSDTLGFTAKQAADQIAAAFAQATPAVQKLSDKMTENQEAALKEQEASIKVRQEFEKSIAPLSNLTDKYQDFAIQGGTLVQYAKLHTEEIIKAGKSQMDLGTQLSHTDAALLSGAQSLQHVSDMAKNQAKPAIDSFAAAVKAMGDAHAQASLVVDASLDKLIDKNADAVDKITIKNPMDALTPTKEDIANLDRGYAEAYETTFGHASALTKAIGGEFQMMFGQISGSLANALIDWSNPGGDILNSIKNFGKSLLATLMDSFLSPFTSALSSIVGNLGSALSSLLSGKGFDLSGLLSGITGTKTGGTTGGTVPGGDILNSMGGALLKQVGSWLGIGGGAAAATLTPAAIASAGAAMPALGAVSAMSPELLASIGLSGAASGAGAAGGAAGAAGAAGGALGGLGSLLGPVGIGASIGATALGNALGEGPAGTALGATIGGVGGAAIAGGLSATLGTGALVGGTLGTGIGGFAAGMGAMMTNPFTIIPAAAALLSYVGYKLATGPDSYEAARDEAQRDLGLDISTEHMKAFFDSVGVSEAQAWGIRKDLTSSPAFLEMAYGAASEQGKTADFLKSLESVNTVMGVGNFRPGFEQYLSSGDASLLNDEFMQLFSGSKALKAIMPDYSKLLIGGSGVSGNPNNYPAGANVIINNITVNNGAVIGTDGDQIIAESIQNTLANGGLTNINNENIG